MCSICDAGGEECPKCEDLRELAEEMCLLAEANKETHFCTQCGDRVELVWNLFRTTLISSDHDCSCSGTVHWEVFHTAEDLSQCKCHLLPEKDMDGSNFTGNCEYCKEKE